MTSNDYAVHLDCAACKPDDAENSRIIDSWVGALRNIHWPVSLTKQDSQNYSANLQRINCGPLSLIMYCSDPIIAKREGKVSSSGSESHFTFNYINKGRLSVDHNNQITDLSKGDFVIADNSLPSTIEFLSKAQTFSIRIPAKLLGIYIDNPRLLCNQIPSGGTLYRGVLKELFFCLWRQCEDGATEESQKAVINTFLSFLAISFETGNKRQLSHAHKSEFLLSRIKEYIDNNLSNIHLSPELVAQEFHISTRYLRKLFQAEGTNSMTDYIRYKRLDKCADDLISIQTDKKSITDIAYFWGFNNSSSFTRAFKAYFGISPMEYKRR